jgi:hypothetical protein
MMIVSREFKRSLNAPKVFLQDGFCLAIKHFFELSVNNFKIC